MTFDNGDAFFLVSIFVIGAGTCWAVMNEVWKTRKKFRRDTLMRELRAREEAHKRLMEDAWERRRNDDTL
jgi:hypothetical protein